MQKALNEMNLHLHHVLSDISGQSGLAILDAILAGEGDPRKLAALAHYRVQKSQAQIEAALTGDYRPELLFVLSQSLHNYRQMQVQIAQCDLSIEKQLAKMVDCTIEILSNVVLRCFLWIVSELGDGWDSHFELTGSVVGGGSEVDKVSKSPSHSFC